MDEVFQLNVNASRSSNRINASHRKKSLGTRVIQSAFSLKLLPRMPFSYCVPFKFRNNVLWKNWSVMLCLMLTKYKIVCSLISDTNELFSQWRHLVFAIMRQIRFIIVKYPLNALFSYYQFISLIIRTYANHFSDSSIDIKLLIFANTLKSITICRHLWLLRFQMTRACAARYKC